MSTSYLDRLRQQLQGQLPFSLLNQENYTNWLSNAKLFDLEPGQAVISPRQLQERIYLLIEGKVRLLAELDGDIFTIDRRGAGQILGWSSLLRGEACEWVIASEKSVVLALTAKEFLEFLSYEKSFADWFFCLAQPQESHLVAREALNLMIKRPQDWKNCLKYQVDNAVACSLSPNSPFQPPKLKQANFSWYLSTKGIPGFSVGSLIKEGEVIPQRPGYKLQYRVIGLPTVQAFAEISQVSKPLLAEEANSMVEIKSSTLQQLGILEDENIDIQDKYPLIRGKGVLQEAMAACEMIALFQKVPFRRDLIKKILEDQFRRDKALTLQLLGGLTESLGLRTQLGTVKNEYVDSIEAPAMMMLEGTPVVLYAASANHIVIGHPRQGIVEYNLDEFKEFFGDSISFAIPRRIGTTPTSRFGWSWFVPLLSKYRKSLILVFISSLLAQLFGLGIPLLIQQIIDKVLAQGNLSSLNVLGSVMILLAVFQGFLLILRTYMFVDTTDRMDLTLGSAVIDRLLSLPLTFFEKRPVGELSQRLGELNSIRGFLTGTALVSVLNIIFAAIYLVVMIIYSPLLTAVALSTLPLYLLLIFGVAPLYRHLTRERAKAQARTQSHLIEILSGIQTVKAQHFELTARWKWQDRYRDFVSEGFKGVVLGTTSGQIGSFLNQLSSLLVLWVGMMLVLDGDLSLGMLIAFRIISGNVTGPLLQLSGLYQGFQKVQISMERLSDILDQNPELSSEDEVNQIVMPPIQGNIRFEEVCFRFGMKGPYQVNRVNLSINGGEFVGIVGQSGSGKSTLTKLLPRLYDVDSGRILIDDYDVSKVELSSLRRQIGIVPQESLLFEGTIADNISLNDPQASTDAIIDAAKIACAHDFIMTLENGYATQLSERGSNLSGGQRQRIAIARTIIANPQLLVMDEATSALDYSTERQLCLNLQSWARGRTVLFITHRLSSIKSSDTIIVMHDGCLVEKGTHDELLIRGERYAALYKQQGD